MPKKCISITSPKLNDAQFISMLNQMTDEYDFDIDVLEKYYMYFDMRNLIRNQKLSLDFIFTFIFENNDRDVEESYIDDMDVVTYQNYSQSEICKFRASRESPIIDSSYAPS